jgi:hypothetical protein
MLGTFSWGFKIEIDMGMQDPFVEIAVLSIDSAHDMWE